MSRLQPALLDLVDLAMATLSLGAARDGQTVADLLDPGPEPGLIEIVLGRRSFT